MPKPSPIGQFTSGIGQGVGLYNALQEAQMRRRKAEAEDAAAAPTSLEGVPFQVREDQRLPTWLKIQEMQSKSKAGAAAPPGLKLKPGEIFDPETQAVKAVQGSDLYINQSGKHSSDRDALQSADMTSDATAKKINDLLSPENQGGFNSQFGGYNALLTRMLPGQTQDVGAKLESLKSDLKMAGLSMIRSGGSIGQVTEREWPIVEGLIGRLDPRMSEQEARQTLQEISARMEAIKKKAAAGYETEWGGTQYYRGQGQPDKPGKRYQILSVE